MEYLAWRVWSGLHNEIELSFMIVGHTKFSPDWAFGLFKRAFKRTKVSCLNDIARVCEASAYVNFAQLVGTQDGSVIVPMYDWSGFFQPFFKADPFSGLKKLYHLRFTSENVGVCFVRETSDGTERKLYVLRKEYTQWRPPKTVLPRRMIPEGLSLERKTYLFEKIGEFCSPECQDLVCPEPGVPVPSSDHPSPLSLLPSSDTSVSPELHTLSSPSIPLATRSPPAKRPRGRPRKDTAAPYLAQIQTSSASSDLTEPQKRGRGRPRKILNL